MADYNLTGLSTRSFEQLIQALATKIIGPATVIFGDGRDGGREATYEGPMSYPSLDAGWNGYMVAQAKFKQRLEGTKRDGLWALEQLKKELEDFANKKKQRRHPDYYLFATNVVLTPFLKEGSKDKVAKLIEPFRKKLGIKDYAIWDYDQLRAFIDDAEDIRRAYAAWITPGDVLSHVMDWIKPETKDFEQILSNFLQKELQIDQYVNLEQAGHAAEDRIPIARVFIDAPALDHSTLEPPEEAANNLPSGFICDVLEIAAQRLDPESHRSQSISSSGRGKLVHFEPGRLVLIGGPGQGKTTFAQFICQIFRAAILKENLKLSAETRQALAVIESQSQKEALPLPTARRFPLRVVLNEFAAALARNETNSLLSYLVDRIRKRTDQTISPNDFRKWLATYPWLLILDGLDEVPASSNREEVLNAIRNFWVDATESNADILVVATTRPQGYSEEFSPDLYRHRWLAPLSTVRALHYARRLVEARYGNDEDRREKILYRLTSASTSDATARLMRSPLQVTIMAALVDKVGKPPQERWTLFRDYYKVIYDREVERDIPAAEILRDYKPDVDTIHYRVGLLLQIEGESSGNTDARLSSARLGEVISDRLVEEEHSDRELEELLSKITKAAAERLVFLVGLESDRVGFEIRSFQEFMAAECLMEGDDTAIRERLREIGTVAHWRNAFLFAAGKCFAERQHLRDGILALCDEMNEDPVDDALRITMSGSQLALDLLEDGPARRQPKYAHALARNALRLLDLQPDGFQKRLAELYEPTLEQVYRKEIEQRLSLSLSKQRLGAWACLQHLSTLNVSWADEMIAAHLPTTDQERGDLLPIVRGRSSKILQALSSSLTSFEPRFINESLQFGQSRTSEIPAASVLPPIALATLSILGYSATPDESKTAKVNLNDAKAEMNVTYRAVEGPNNYLVFKELETFHSAWAPFVAASRFSEGPTKASLAAALRFVADRWWPILYDASLLPWPLGGLCSAAKTADDLKTFATRTEQGEFGDIEDWRRAEARWQLTGLTEQDLLYSNDHWPFDKLIQTQGFPFTTSLRLALVQSPRQHLGPLIQLYQHSTRPELRALLAESIALYKLRASVMFVGEDFDLPIDLNVLRQMIDDLQGRFRNRLLIICIVEAKAVEFREWVNLVDEVGRKFAIDYAPQNTRSAAALAEAFVSDPSLHGVLRVFSYCSSAKQCALIPASLLNVSDYDEPRLKESAIVVRLGQSVDEAEQLSLAASAAELASNSRRLGFESASDAIRRILSVIANSDAGDVSREPFLLALHKALPAGAIETQDQVIYSLTQELRLRLSSLRDPKVWERLRLPEGLASII